MRDFLPKSVDSVTQSNSLEETHKEKFTREKTRMHRITKIKFDELYSDLH